MIKHTKRVIIFIIGIVFLFLGILGLALPFLQGFLFLIIALLLFSIYSPSLQRWIEERTKPYPKIHEMVLKVQAFINRIVGEV